MGKSFTVRVPTSAEERWFKSAKSHRRSKYDPICELLAGKGKAVVEPALDSSQLIALKARLKKCYKGLAIEHKVKDDVSVLMVKK